MPTKTEYEKFKILAKLSTDPDVEFLIIPKKIIGEFTSTMSVNSAYTECELKLFLSEDWHQYILDEMHILNISK